MKRKRKTNKLTYSELKEAGHEELANHILRRRNTTIRYIQKFGNSAPNMKGIIPKERRYFTLNDKIQAKAP